MSIIGGAVLTALMGAISDASAINWAMAVPGGCFAVVALFGLTAARPAVAALKTAPTGVA